ncbi:hypothetical protein [Nannocystis pusilla]|uniref:hypothetical protein n=1 Tax=Nannocystis pusilla TaxID=889268 RepID=UPI003DA6AB10
MDDGERALPREGARAAAQLGEVLAGDAFAGEERRALGRADQDPRERDRGVLHARGGAEQGRQAGQLVGGDRRDVRGP